MSAIATTIDLASLATVTGGAQSASAVIEQHSAQCEMALNGLIERRHAVPSSFIATCGELLPQLRAGRRVDRDNGGVARSSSQS